MDRRLFLTSTLGLANLLSRNSRVLAGAEIPAHAQDSLAGLVSNYESLSSYRDTAAIKSGVLGRAFEGQTASAFQAPNSLCMQVRTRGRVVAGVIAHDTNMGSWTDEKGWKPLAELSFVLASAKGQTAMLGLAGHWVVGLLFPPDLILGHTLRELADMTCAPPAEGCSRLRGRIEDSQYSITIDPALNLIRAIDSEDAIGTARVVYEPIANPQLDFTLIASRFMRSPSQPFLFR
jgi:hypothetical protein